MYNKEFREVHYSIHPDDHTIRFNEIDGLGQMYDRHQGFIRVAKVPVDKKPFFGQMFRDHEFDPPQLHSTRYIRLYEYFDEDVPLFPPKKEQQSAYIHQQEHYNSFMAESGVISLRYLQSLFITQNVNEAGYYQYFVKRDGQYYVEEVDDLIPIDIKTRRPIWGLSIKHPWQIILLKAWLKQTRSWQNLESAEPFAFLDAFGLPSYRTFNFRKEVQFLKNQKVSMKNREDNIKNFTLNKQNGVVIIAQTLNERRLQSIGLVPGVAAYRLIRVTDGDRQPYYRLYSSLPCRWVGKMTPIEETGLNKMPISEYYIDLQRNFIITEQEALNFFGKCYVVPKQFTDIEHYISQDVMEFQAEKYRNMWLSFRSEARTPGLLAISIEVPRSRYNRNEYPEIKYFLSKKNDEEEVRRSRIRDDIKQSKKEDNMYVESNCDKWQEYRIDYHQSYHHSAAFYTKIVHGQYMFFLCFDQDTRFKIRFDASVTMTRPEIVYPDARICKQIFDSTFFDLANHMGVETAFHKKYMDQTIIISNSFDQVGYGAVVITTMKHAVHKVAMRVYPEKLKQGGYDLLDNFYQAIDMDRDNVQKTNKGYILISEKGRPEIVVIKRIDPSMRTIVGTQFPPPGSIQFFKITPKGVATSQVNRSVSRSKTNRSKNKPKGKR